MKKRIISYFRKHPTAKLKARQLAVKFNLIQENELQEMKHFLFQLSEEGVLQKDKKKYSLSRKATGALTGTISVIDKGSYAFVVLDDKKLKDVFIAQRNLKTALSGDKVEISLLAKQRGKSLEGEVLKVIQRRRTELIGTLKKTKAFYVVIPDNKEIHKNIYVAEKDLGKAGNGDKVVVGEIEWENETLNPEGKITEVLGKAGSYESEIASLSREFNLPLNFPKEVLDEAEKISLEISSEEIKKRLDLRSEMIFTIDPADAKDFDDAVSIKKLSNGNFSIGVHIADVSHYVQPGSPLYKEAYKRGTSVYFVGCVVPMLPERLSNQICSLVPNEDRLTYSVIVEMSSSGEVVSYQIKKTIINSKKRFSYEEAQSILNSGKGELFDELFQLNNFAKTLRKKRMSAGSINFITPEVKFELDEKGKPISIKPRVTLETNELIEEYMLLANRIVAKHIAANKTITVPFIYRIHDLPDEEKLNGFAGFVRSFGYSFDPKQAENSKQFQNLLENIKGKEEEAVINEVAIRSMAKAIYSSDNIGHYGLGFEFYSHFTSPIRRFPDLIAHLLLHHYNLNGNKEKIDKIKLETMCEHCSAQERNSISAERESVKIKQIEFLQDKVGEEYNGVISGVTNFGLFVKLNSILCEGLVRMSDLSDDFYKHDEKNYALIGRSTKKKYSLGDKVKVKVVRVDPERKMMDFLLV